MISAAKICPLYRTARPVLQLLRLAIYVAYRADGPHFQNRHQLPFLQSLKRARSKPSVIAKSLATRQSRPMQRRRMTRAISSGFRLPLPFARQAVRPPIRALRGAHAPVRWNAARLRRLESGKLSGETSSVQVFTLAPMT